jgi:hypothetical protein
MKNSYLLPLFILFISISSLNLISQEDECDILCRAGITSEDYQQNNRSNTNQSKSNKKSFSSYSNSNLFITGTENSRRAIADFKKSLYENFDDLSYAPYDLDIEISSAYGTIDNFRLEGLDFLIIDKDISKKYQYADIGSLMCSGYAGGYGINDSTPLKDMLKLKQISLEPSGDYFCRLNDLSFNLDSIETLTGESPEWYMDASVWSIIEPLTSDMDTYFKYSATSGGNNIIRAKQKSIMSFDNSSVSLLFEADSSANLDIINVLIKEIKEILTMLVGREAVSSLANSEELFPWDEYINIVNKVSEASYDDAFDEAEARFAQLENKLESGLTQKVYGVSLGINWSDEMFRKIAYASGGTLDAGLLVAKGVVSNKMNKYELQMLLQNAGLDRDLQGLYLDYMHTLYDQMYDEAKLFVNNPRGLLLELSFPMGIDETLIYQLEENPMMAFNILNNMEFKIKANPTFKN